MTEVNDRCSRTPMYRLGSRYVVTALVAASVAFLVTCSATDEASTEEPVIDDGAHRAPRVAMVVGEGAEPVGLRVFDCRPVRNDERRDSDQYPVPLPPFSKDVFPCTRCHDRPDDHNGTPRTLTLEHLDIKLVHGPREQWCYDCHNPTDRDQLRLAGGRLVSFRTSYLLCGQCHGEKLRDWRLGIHGRRIGCWNGKREYLLCVHCHSPHSPKFEPVSPLPRPKLPSEIQLNHHAGR